MGRIGEAVREKVGLAYHVSSSVSGGLGPGPWFVSAGVDPGNVDRVIEIISDELTRFVNEPVSEAELADSVSNYIGSLPLSLEANAGVGVALTHIERYQLGLDYFQRYSDILHSITAQDILRTARGYLDPARIAIAVAGPETHTSG
jgi:zinc protease